VSVGVFDDALLGGLFGDEEVAGAFAAEATLERYRAFEAALTRALAAEGLIDDAAAEAILAGCASFRPDVAAIAAATARDGVPVPEYVRQLRAHVGDPHAAALHLGATSQDLVDTALVQALDDVNAILAGRLRAVDAALDTLTERFGAAPLMGRTRMQAAVSITVGDRVAAWRAPLPWHLDRLAGLSPRLHALQFGGAVGTRHALGDRGEAVAARLAEALGFAHAPKAWHAERDGIAEYGAWLSLVTGSLGKIGQDVALMAQQGLDEIALADGGSSSAMPHKRNPVQAELLVTLARFNATQLAGLHHALVHEQERSGAAWAVEWMLLPPMCVATGTALATAQAMFGSVERLGAPA